ncbi:purine permease [Leucobacter zeae]|nr:purine permease [Leucobacter zeae]
MGSTSGSSFPGTIDVAGEPEDERLGVGRSFAYGLQHVLTMYGGIIAPPIIIGNAVGADPAAIGMLIASCLFIGGLATLLQSLGLPFFGSKLPLVQGTSFASVATMTAIVTGDGSINEVFGAVLAASAMGFLITPFFAQIIRFFPPVVTGVVITSIGLSLIPVAGNWIMGGNAQADDYGSVIGVGLAAITLVAVIVFSKVGRGMISRLSILLGLVVGTVVAIPMGLADFSKVADGSIFAIPTPFAFGWPEFNVASILSMFIVVLVILTETAADILAVGEITGSKVDAKRIGNGLRADMLSSMLSPVFNSFTQSAFAQNVGLVAITGIKSRFVVAAGGVILVILGVLPVLGRVAGAIPMPVLGGAGIVLFGTVAASGIRTLSKVSYKDNMNLVIVATSLAFGLLPVVKPDIYSQFPDWFEVIFHSGISSATLMAILLNIFFNELKFGSGRNKNAFVASPPRMVREDEVRALEDGDTFVGGKLISKEGAEVPIVRVNELGAETTSLHIPTADQVRADTSAISIRRKRRK